MQAPRPGRQRPTLPGRAIRRCAALGRPRHPQDHPAALSVGAFRMYGED